jgi:hypothetical protein
MNGNVIMGMAVRRIGSIKGGMVSFSNVDFDGRGQERSRDYVSSVEEYCKSLADAIGWGIGFFAESLKFAPDGIYMVCDESGAIHGLTELGEGGPNCENHAEFGYFNFHVFAKVGTRLLGYCENYHCANHKALGIVDVVDGIKNGSGNERTSVLCLACKYTDYVAKW